MPFPIPPQIWANRPITSIWTDFTNAYNGKTLIGSYPAGAFMADWTLRNEASSPDAYEVAPLVGSISGQAFYIADSGTTTFGPNLFSWNAIAPAADVEVLAGIYIETSVGNPAGQTLGPMLRKIAGGNHQAYVFLQKNSDLLNRFFWISQSTTDNDQAFIDFNWAIANFYWIRFQYIGDALKAKVWARTDPEPSMWMVDTTSSMASGVGYTGLYGDPRTPGEFYCDFFSVSLDGTPAYGPGL